MDEQSFWIKFIASFGISPEAGINQLFYLPLYVVAVSVVLFFWSNHRAMKEERKNGFIENLRRAGENVQRGISAQELARRIAPENTDTGARKVMVEIAELMLKLAKFDRRATEQKLIQAGDRDPRAISRYILQRGAAMAIGPLIGWPLLAMVGFEGVSQIAGSAVFVLAGGILVDVRLDKLLKERRSAFESEFPVLLDLLTIYLEAGRGFDVALQKASVAMQHSFPIAADEVSHLRQDLELSVDREKTLRDFGQRVKNGTADTFVAIVIQAEKRGNAVAPSLRTLSREARQEAIHEVERKAQKIPTLMQGPMFVLILPAIFLSVMGPTIVSVIVQFGAGG